jgi:integrase
MAEVIAQFELSVVPGLRGKHRQETERQLKLLGRVLGAKKAIDIGGDDWLRLQWMIMSGAIDARGNPVPQGKRRPVGQRTAAKVLKTLRHICRHAQTVRRDGRPLLRFDPTVGLEVPTNSDPAQPVCDDQTYEKLRDATKSHRVRLVGGKRPSPMPVLLTLAAETGRRIGAIVALRWEDWNPDAGTFGTLTWRADADKLRRTTTTPVTPDVRKALEEHRLENSGIGEGWIFPAPRGRGHVTVSVVGRWLKACETAAEISHQKGFGWHALRRAFATKRKGMSIQDVAALGGWKGTQVLRDLYQRADLDAMERVLLEGQKVRLRSVR